MFRAYRDRICLLRFEGLFVMGGEGNIGDFKIRIGFGGPLY